MWNRRTAWISALARKVTQLRVEVRDSLRWAASWLWGRSSAWLTPDSLGLQGERWAERYLRRQGYRIVARGYRALSGEIDLIAVEGRTVVFVEVKTRGDDERGCPAEAVDAEKERCLTRTALVYLKKHHLLEYSARFDVVALTWPSGERQPHVLHIRNAFPAVGTGQMFS